MQATGKFTVQLDPQDSYAQGEHGNTLGRMTIDKSYEGDLEATGRGEMLSARTTTPGSAGYVAIEQVSGELDGRKGSFILQHYGVMSDGENDLKIEVVPGSGTGQLEALEGVMHIRIENGEHYYRFEYQLN